MTKHTRLLPVLLICYIIPVAACAGSTAEKTGPGPADYVPLGVYTGFNRIEGVAEYNDVKLWDTVDKRLALLHQYHVNTIWVNLRSKNVGPLAKACKKHKIKLLAHPWSLEIKWVPGVGTRAKTPQLPHKKQVSIVKEKYEKVMPPLLKQVPPGHESSVAGWVISDEPQKGAFFALEKARQVIRKLDPTRLTLNVTQRNRAIYELKHTKFPVLVQDNYLWLASTSPNGPHTDNGFVNLYRSRIGKFVDLVLAHNRIAWIMPQAFAMAWGPHKLTPQGRVIALPGSYAVWQMPSPAMVKWQVWEAIRAGAKGVIFFISTAKAPNPKTIHDSYKTGKTHPAIDKPEKLGYSGLVTVSAKATPQLKALGEAFGKLAQVAPLIQRWKRIRAFSGLVHAESGFAVGSFRDPKTGTTYLVVVNDDFDRTQTGTLKLPSGTTGVKDIISHKKLNLSTDKTIEVNLPAGGGTILRLQS